MYVNEQGQCGISQLRLLPAEVGPATYPHNKARVTAASADRILEWATILQCQVSSCLYPIKSMPGVNFINILQAPLKRADPKSIKRQTTWLSFFAHLGSACKTLMKLTQGYNPIAYRTKVPNPWKGSRGSTKMRKVKQCSHLHLFYRNLGVQQ